MYKHDGASFTFPIAYSNTNYRIIGGACVLPGFARRMISNKTTTGFKVTYDANQWYVDDILCIGY